MSKVNFAGELVGLLRTRWRNMTPHLQVSGESERLGALTQTQLNEWISAQLKGKKRHSVDGLVAHLIRDHRALPSSTASLLVAQHAPPESDRTASLIDLLRQLERANARPPAELYATLTAMQKERGDAEAVERLLRRWEALGEAPPSHEQRVEAQSFGAVAPQREKKAPQATRPPEAAAGPSPCIPRRRRGGFFYSSLVLQELNWESDSERRLQMVRHIYVSAMAQYGQWAGTFSFANEMTDVLGLYLLAQDRLPDHGIGDDIILLESLLHLSAHHHLWNMFLEIASHISNSGLHLSRNGWNLLWWNWQKHPVLRQDLHCRALLLGKEAPSALLSEL